MRLSIAYIVPPIVLTSPLVAIYVLPSQIAQVFNIASNPPCNEILGASSASRQTLLQQRRQSSEAHSHSVTSSEYALNRSTMPLYELFCLTRPAAGRQALAQIIKTAGQAVHARGGVVTDVTFFGQQQLAYEIRKPAGKFDQVRKLWVPKGGCLQGLLLSKLRCYCKPASR